MRKTAAVLTFAAALLMVLSSAATAQALDGKEIDPAETYVGGARVKSTTIGLSFKVPQGTSLAPLSQYGFYQLSPAGGSRGGLLIVRTGLTFDDISATLPADLDLMFIHTDAYFTVADKPAQKDGKTIARYTGDAGACRALGTSSYLLVLFDADDAKAKEGVDAFDKDVVTATPADAEAKKKWRGEVESKVLTVAGGEQTVECKFTKDGKYALKLSDGANSQSQTGKWSVDVSPFGGVLTLVADNGTRNYYTMTLSGSDLALNGMVYARKALDDNTSAGNAGSAGKLARPAEAEEKGRARKVAADPNWKSDQKEVEKLEGDEIQLNTPVMAEKRVKTDFLGVSFKHPAGMAGGVDARVPLYLLKPTDGKGFGMVYIQTGMISPAHVAAFMHQELDLNSIEKGLVMQPDGDAKIEGGKITQDYKHELVTARAMALVGPSGNGVLVCFIGAIADKAKMHEYVKTIIDSVQLAKPQAETRRAELEKQLHGKYLMVYRYKSASGASGNSSSWETKIWYHFGSDGTYYYRYKFVGDHYVKGTDSVGDTKYIAGAASENDREDKGKWRVEFNITGAMLYTTNDQGLEREHQIRVANNKVFFDEEEVSVGQSDIKK